MARKTTSASVESSVSAADRETLKHSNFRRLMNARLHKLLDQFKACENTTNPSSYVWTEEEAAAINEHINKAAASLKARLGAGSDTVKVNGKTTRVLSEII